ncbi:MAG: DUF2635 domain-containing protein [Micavibrio aeruginosavorus]|uniref:DUF2635 domain-containing protein n=1 Tax=Micavibrio aeruginosavorus TaxID=349221 RepID=A0A2W5Q1F7_9BACT|nr:MAG: DUF2635 domain-containing protein [Micavibrio aeruginosavorus]
MKKIFIKPTTDLLIIDPETNCPIPKEGVEVEDGQYWQRRLLDRDITIEEPKKSKKQ